jgi:hypothetical protein
MNSNSRYSLAALKRRASQEAVINGMILGFEGFSVEYQRNLTWRASQKNDISFHVSLNFPESTFHKR